MLDKEEKKENNTDASKFKMFSSEIKERQRKQRKYAFVWPTASFVLHIALFAVVILCTPLKEIVFPEEKEKEEASSQISELSERELENLTEEIEEARENEIAKDLQELQTVLHNMEFMENELLKDYEEFAEDMAEEIKPEMEQLFDEVLKKQEESLEHQKITEEFIEEFVDQQEKVADKQSADEQIKDVNETEKEFQTIEDAQADAQNLLDIIAAKAEIVGMEKTAKAVQQAFESQREANNIQAEAKQLVWDIRNLNDQASKKLEDKAKEQEKLQNEAKPQTEQAEKNLAEKKSEKEKASQELTEAEKAKSEAEKNRSDAQQAERKAIDEFNKANDELNRANNNARSQDNNVSQKERDKNSAKDRTARAEQEFEKAKKAEAEKQEKADKAKEALAAAEQKKAEAEQNKDQNPNAVRDANNNFNAAKRNAEIAQNELKNAQNNANNRQSELERAKADLANREQQLVAAQAARDEAKSAKQEKEQNRAAAEQAKKSAEAARKEAEAQLRQANDKLNQARNTNNRAQNNLANAQRDLDRKKSNEANSEKRIAEYDASAQQLLATAKEKSQLLDAMDAKASQQQAKTLEIVKQVASIAAQESPTPPELADDSMESPDLANVPLTNLPLADAYDKAKELEQQIAERSRNIKAIDLAISQQMSLSDAIEITDVATPLRPEFNRDILESTPQSEGEFVEKKEEMTKVVQEVGNMTAVAKSAMADAEISVFPERYDGNFSSGKGSRQDRLSRMYEISNMENQIKSAGAESSTESAKDLAAMMAAADAAKFNSNSSSQSSSSQHGSSASSSSRGSKKQGGSASAANTSQWIPTKYQGSDLTGAKSAFNVGVRGGDAPGLGVPPLSRGMDGLVSGNFIGKGGTPAVWARIVNWYIIGPFDNPNRVNLTRKFAPENVVNLDASYVGKHGKIIKWEYCAFERRGEEVRPYTQRELEILRRGELKPEYRDDHQYEIWYAYTEIFMEEEDDVWIAVGSDDRMDVWINDYHVWGSSNQLKYWRINEGFRKVHLRKGRNTVLVRVENGQYVISWSMFLSKEMPQ